MPLVTLFLNEKMSNTSPFQRTFVVPEHEGIVGFTVTGTVIVGIIPEPPVNGNGDNDRHLLFGFGRTFAPLSSTVSVKINGVTEESVYTTGGIVTFSFDKYIEGENVIGMTMTAPDGYIATGTFTAQMSYTEPPPSPVAPVIIDSSPDAVSVVEGTNEYIFATATDIDPADYGIKVDGMLYDSGQWSSPTMLQYVCGELSMGDHTVSFYFSDQTGLSATRTIVVVVEEAPPPILPPVITESSPDVVNTIEGEYCSIFASAEDIDPSTYEITVDGALVESGDWVSPAILWYSCTELSEGTYNIIFRFNDQSGLYSVKTIAVVVAVGEGNGPPEWWEEIDVLWVVGGIVTVVGIGAAAWFLLPK